MKSAFEELMSRLMQKDYGSLVKEAASMKPGLSGKMPYRYRVIALGFVMKLSLEEVNRRLQEGGEAKLYARSYTEATLIYAFRTGMSCENWLNLYEDSRSLFESAAEAGGSGMSKPTLDILREYVSSASETQAEERTRATKAFFSSSDKTGLFTKRLEMGLNSLEDERLLRAFLCENILSFCPARENARYYFCKYLCLYLESIINEAVIRHKNGRPYSELLAPFMNTGSLPKKLEEGELCRLLSSARISCGALFDLFDMFYFGYVSVDWMEKLMEELEGDPEQLPAEKQEQLAKHLRAYYPEWKHMTDSEIIRAKLDADSREEARLDSLTAEDFYGLGRSGEKSVRGYIKGTLDIDRTSLIFYMMFFGSALKKGDPNAVTAVRLNEILEKCGFAPLDGSRDALDCFTVNYLSSGDRAEYLEQSISACAAQEMNFPLFRLYHDAVSNSDTAKRVFGGGK